MFELLLTVTMRRGPDCAGMQCHGGRHVRLGNAMSMMCLLIMVPVTCRARPCQKLFEIMLRRENPDWGASRTMTWRQSTSAAFLETVTPSGFLRLRGGTAQRDNDGGQEQEKIHGGHHERRLSEQMVELWETAAQLRRRRLENTTRDMAVEREGGALAGETQSLEEMKALLRHPSALLRHEVCYALGQAGLASAAPTLSAVLSNASEHSMVRHEAAEALAAIGAVNAAPILCQHVSDPSPEVADTCRVALDRLSWEATRSASADRAAAAPAQLESTLYESIDPAPSLGEPLGLGALRARFLDAARSLFERYRALFALRDLGGEEAVEAIALGLEDGSALFRHEVAFVLGQMSNRAAHAALLRVLEDRSEAAMVRHEAAEAIGHLGLPESREVLERHCADAEEVVAHSCQVALDMNFYWSKFASQPA